MKVRFESEFDTDEVWQLNSLAFPTNAEAKLVNALRSSTKCISLVADIGGKVVGHILFSSVHIDHAKTASLVGLAPMAVLPEMQNSGIGSKLIQRGISECLANGVNVIVVLGHPNFYTKFGFQSSIKFGIKSEYDVPDDVFMVLELTPETLENIKGTIKYHNAFKNV